MEAWTVNPRAELEAVEAELETLRLEEEQWQMGREILGRLRDKRRVVTTFRLPGGE